MGEKPRIKVNKARCRICGDIIESMHRHDFVTCSCGSLSVDGGKDYIRRCYDPKTSDPYDVYDELSEYEKE